MNKLCEMKESLINGGTSKFAPRKSSFVTVILLKMLPTGAKLPSLETYDGTSNPEDHLAQFYAVMHLHRFCDAIWCKTFPTTFRGAACVCFNQLPVNSISSFEEFTDIFCNHFIASKPSVRNASYLYTVEQGPEESL